MIDARVAFDSELEAKWTRIQLRPSDSVVAVRLDVDAVHGDSWSFSSAYTPSDHVGTGYRMGSCCRLPSQVEAGCQA